MRGILLERTMAPCGNLALDVSVVNRNVRRRCVMRVLRSEKQPELVADLQTRWLQLPVVRNLDLGLSGTGVELAGCVTWAACEEDYPRETGNGGAVCDNTGRQAGITTRR